MVETRNSLVTDIDDGALFAIDRPSKLNTVTSAVLDELEECLDYLENGRAKLLIIHGSGERAFCAGTDLAELQGMSHEAQIAKCNRARDLLVRLSRSSILSVAAVDGIAFGAGMELAMACTLRIGGLTASFSLPEVKLGLLPAYAGTQMLPAIVGKTRAEEIMLTGRQIDAEEAERIGLLHRIARDGQPTSDAAVAFGREVTCHSALAVRAIRNCVNAFDPGDMETGLRAEQNAVRDVFGSPDALEGVGAFLEKRALR